MSYVPDYGQHLFAADAAASDRATFLRKTYMHLCGSVLAFTAIEAYFLTLPNIDQLVMQMFARGNMGIIVIMIAFMLAGWIARVWAHNSSSLTMQYLGLALYVGAEAVIFVPLLWYAKRFAGPDTIPAAASMTLALFAGLTLVVFVSGINFSFLRVGLMFGSFAAIALAIGGMIFGFTLGFWFAAAMVVLACGFILFDTWNVLHNFRTDQYVGASLELFASLALLFYYVLRIAIELQRKD